MHGGTDGNTVPLTRNVNLEEIEATKTNKFVPIETEMRNARKCFTYAFPSDQNVVVIAALPVEHAPRRSNTPRTRIVAVRATCTTTAQNKNSYKQLE